LNFNCVYLYKIIDVRPYDPFKWQCCFGDLVADCTWKVSSSLIQRTTSVYPSLKERPSSLLYIPPLVVNMVVLFDRKITESSRAIFFLQKWSFKLSFIKMNVVFLFVLIFLLYFYGCLSLIRSLYIFILNGFYQNGFNYW